MEITTASFDHCVKSDIWCQFTDLIDTTINPVTGEILEFGVFKGNSIRFLANRLPSRKIYGFDSFEGLPEDWVRNEYSTYKTGHFKTAIPAVPDNVTLIKGFFNDSLPEWIQTHNPKFIAFIHIDSDLYSSAITILRTLNHAILPGTVIVFDELCDWSNSVLYRNWKAGEWKALQEWVSEFDREVIPISRTPKWSAAIKVIT